MENENADHVKRNRYIQYSQFFLWIGHILSLMIVLKMIKAILWGLKNKEDFIASFFSSFGSTDLLVEKELADGSFQIMYD